MLLIAGLGNPGPRYELTRHNVGFMLIDRLSSVYNIRCGHSTGKALWGRGLVAGREVVLIKPMTFVNLSGEAVEDFLSEFRVPIESLVVVYDDCYLPLGRIRIRPAGGGGGHKGVDSIIRCLGSDAFPRIRLGIGRPMKEDLADYVLSPFTPEEMEVVDGMLERAVSSIEVLATEGIAGAMNKFNKAN
ncbi:MAG: aminoacyl-tRNA hydrolase [Thermodesulfobacteriota bacterium]|nr:MAG: aminoacyl-tRNA hydrolase [Thermodesulfobacteriota bacterium]